MFFAHFWALYDRGDGSLRRRRPAPCDVFSAILDHGDWVIATNPLRRDDIVARRSCPCLIHDMSQVPTKNFSRYDPVVVSRRRFDPDVVSLVALTQSSCRQERRSDPVVVSPVALARLLCRVVLARLTA